MRMIFRCDPMLADHLPRPVPARSGLPDWLRDTPATARLARELAGLAAPPS